jgi:hypothetical protein
MLGSGMFLQRALNSDAAFFYSFIIAHPVEEYVQQRYIMYAEQ